VHVGLAGRTGEIDMNGWIRMTCVLILGASLATGCRPGEQGAAQRIAVQVTAQGFQPADVTVRAGEPVTLVVTRTTDQTCAKEIVFEATGVRRELPLGEPVEITFTPDRPGEIHYACGMNMLTGKVTVQEPGARQG
jgi:plastocyanin domain-containing protein